MAYIAKIALSHGGRFIKKGEEVPPNYKRFAEGIRRGWIEVTDDPAASNLPIADSTETIVPEDPPEYAEPSIEDLDYLMPMARTSLAQKGIVSISDLEGWDADTLNELHGIGVKLTERLLADFAEYAKWKESFSEYQEVQLDAEIEVVSVEEVNAGDETVETGEPGEDEDSEDD